MENESIQNTTQKGSSFFGKCMGVCTFLTVMSQMPQIVDMGLSSLISRVVWIGFFVLIFVVKGGNLPIYRDGAFGFVAVGVVVLLAFGISVIRNQSYYATSLFSALLLSIFILFTGMSIGRNVTKRDLELCAKAYVFASLILAVELYITVFRFVDIDNVIYAYESKNSAGVILFTAFLIALIYGWKAKKIFPNVVNFAIIAFFVYMIMMMKVRAMIVCFPVVALVTVLRAPLKKSLRILLVILCIVLLVALQNEEFYDTLINKILLANRQADDINSISSGRINQWKLLGENLVGNWVIGDGRTEQESLILTAWIQWGVFIGSLIIAYAMWPLAYALRNIKRNNTREMFLLLLIALTYFIDAIFEQLAPFGPGGRCFYLWLLFGILLARKTSMRAEPIFSSDRNYIEEREVTQICERQDQMSP